MDCAHWYGLPPPDCDVPHWIPYLDAGLIGMDPQLKVTLPWPPGDDVDGLGRVLLTAVA